MSGRIQIRLLCPELGESYLFMKWLGKRYGVELSAIKLPVGYGELMDRVLAIEFSHDGALVRVASPFPEPALAQATIIASLLRGVDGAAIVLRRRPDEIEANCSVARELLTRLSTLGFEPRVILNDSAEGGTKPLTSAVDIATKLGIEHGIHETRLGPVKGSLRYDDGVEAAWNALLEAAAKPKGSTPYR